MRIERIEIRHTRMELVTSFETSMGVESHENHIMVRVDGEGVTGWGECVVEEKPLYSSETVQTAWPVLEECLIPAVDSICIRISIEEKLIVVNPPEGLMDLGK